MDNSISETTIPPAVFVVLSQTFEEDAFTFETHISPEAARAAVLGALKRGRLVSLQFTPPTLRALADFAGIDKGRRISEASARRSCGR